MSATSNVSQANTVIKPADSWLLWTAVLLIVGGTLLVFDSSYSYASDTHKDVFFIFKKQLVAASIGVLAMMVASRMSLRFIRMIAPLSMAIAIVLMLLVYTPLGREINGARSWVQIFGVIFQPSEILKVALVMYLARVLTQGKIFVKGMSVYRWMFPAFVACVAVGLTVMQKDMGTASVLVMIALFTFYAAGARKRALALVLVGLVAIPLLVLGTGLRNNSHFSHINARVQVFKDPWKSPLEEGYQTIQSLTALGTGGWTGRGWCRGKAKLLIPEVFNDYAATTLAEEGGLIAMLVLIAAYCFLTYLGFDIARRARHSFGTVLAVGLTSVIAIQTLLNLAVVSAAVPATGVPLPFLSAGGTALVVNTLAVGLILAVSSRQNEELEDLIPDESSVDRRRNRRPHLSGNKRGTGNSKTKPRRRPPFSR